MDEDTFDSVVDAFENSKPQFIDDNGEVEEIEEDLEEVQEEEADEESEEELEDSDEDGEEEGGDPSDDDESDGDPDGQSDEDPEFEVTVDGESRKAKLSELTRLYGQEAALTKRSQAVADQNRVLEAQGLYLSKIYDTRLETARKAVEKYKDVDLFQAYRELDQDEFEALKTAKEAADAELAVIEREAGDFVQKAHQAKQTYLRQEAQKAIPVIKKAIPDWTDKTYADVRSYAVSQGMPASAVNEIVDPAAIVMIHKAMQFDSTKSKAAEVKKKVTKTSKKATRKSTNKVDSQSQSLKRLRAKAAESGDIDDIAAAFLAANSK